MARRRKNSGGVSFFAFQDVITSVVGIFILITLIMVLELAQTVAEASVNSSPVITTNLIQTLQLLREDVERLQREYADLLAAAEESASFQPVNVRELEKRLEAELKQTQDRMERSTNITAELEQSLVEAKRRNEQLVADSRAVESDRQELDEMVKKKTEIQRLTSQLEIERPIVYRDVTQTARRLVLLRLVDRRIEISDSLGDTSLTLEGADQFGRLTTWLQQRDMSKRHVLLLVKPSGVANFHETNNILARASVTYGFDVATEGSKFLLRSELEPAK